MAAYVISDVEVLDTALMEKYRSLAQTTIAKHGGHYVVRGAGFQTFPTMRLWRLKFGHQANTGTPFPRLLCGPKGLGNLAQASAHARQHKAAIF
jgi:hypothetical protein